MIPEGRVKNRAVNMNDDAKSTSRSSFCDSGGTFLKNIFCPQTGLVGGADREMSSETRRLLAFRLTVVAGAFALSSGLYALRSILLPATEGVCLQQQLVAWVIFLISAFILYRNQSLPLRSLRFFEFSIFGVMVIHLFRYYYLWTSEQPDSTATLAIYRAAIKHT